MEKTVGMISRMITAATCAVMIVASIFVVPGIFGVRPYIVQSGSMEPAVHTGAVAFIDTKSKEPNTGDIVTYRLAGSDGQEILVTHRITSARNGIYTTKGDANDTEDLSVVTRKQIVGTYVFQIPKAGYLLAGIKRKGMTVIAAWIVLLNGMSLVAGTVLDRKEPEERQPTKDNGHGVGSGL